MLADVRREMLVRTMRLLDLAVLSSAFLLSLAMSSGSFSWTSFSEILFIRIALHNLLLFAAFLAFSAAIFWGCGLYRSHRLSRWDARLYEILLAVTLVTTVLVIMRSLFHFAFANNAFLLLFWLLNVCELFATRESMHLALHYVRSRGRNLRNIVVVGEEPDATVLAQRLQQEVSFGYQVLRVIDASEVKEWSKRS